MPAGRESGKLKAEMGMVRHLPRILCACAVVATAATSVAPDRQTATRPADGPAARTATNPAMEFTVATYNINYGNVNLKQAAQTIRKSKADFVFLQETNDESARYFRRSLRLEYPHMRFRRARGAGGFGFLSKAPLTKLNWMPPKFGWLGTWMARVKLGGKHIQVANVHLQPIVPAKKEKIKGLMKMFLATEVIRAKEIVRIHSALAESIPTIIAGDLNSTSKMTSPQYLTARGFIDSFAAVVPNADKQITWHWLYRGVHWKFRLDYIFHSAEIKTLRSRVIRSKASDHYLLVSTLTWSSKKAVATMPAATAPAVKDDPRRGSTGSRSDDR